MWPLKPEKREQSRLSQREVFPDFGRTADARGLLVRD